MNTDIRAGTMLIENGTRLPEPLVVGTTPYFEGWSCITDSTSVQLGKDIEKAGWTFFFMAGQGYGTSFGFSDKARMHRAVGQVIQMVRQEKCNCVEITGINRRSFLGIPYLTVEAHARHIQESQSFFPLSSDPPKGYAARGRPVAVTALQITEDKSSLRAEPIQT